jgi:hypothetical protein
VQEGEKVREEICGILESYMLNLLAGGAYGSVGYLLGESDQLIRRANNLLPAHKLRLAALPTSLSDPSVLSQLLEALDHSDVIPEQAELDALFDQLRGGVLGTVLGWLKQAQKPELRTALERAAVRGLIVRHGRQRLDVGTGGGERGRKHRSIRFVDLTGAELVSGAGELAARCEDGDARASRAGQSGHAGGGESADLHRPEANTGRNDDVSRSHVAAARPNVRAGRNRFANVDNVVTLDNILDGDDGVGARGDDPACRDLHRFARLERALRRTAGCDPLNDWQRRGQVGGAYRKAVHRGARERRQVDKRPDRLRRDASGGFPNGHRLRRERLRTGEHERLRLLECE